jgi:hypothetical protein
MLNDKEFIYILVCKLVYIDFGVGMSFFEFEGRMKFVEVNDTRITIKP